MPVEFECPHCRKTLRTQDVSMGLKVGCNHCGDLLRVPVVEIPQSAVADTATFNREAINRRIEAGAAAEFAATSSSPGKPYRRRKRRSNTGWWLLLGVLAVIGAGYGGYTYITNAVQPLTGSLAGSVAAAPNLDQVLTLPDGGGADAALAILDDGPVAVEGPTYRLELTTAGEDGRDVIAAYQPGEDTRTVQVDLNADPAAMAYLKENAERLRSRVERAIRDETAAFAASDVDRGAIAMYLERTASLAHVDGIGAFVLGGAGSVGFPVVAEPEPGVLLFIVPSSLKRIELLPSAGRGDTLPREFAYTVTLP